MNDKVNEPSYPSRGQEDCPLDSSSSRKETAEKPLRGQIGGIGAQLGANQFSVSAAIGGPWGALEATLPTLLVVAVYLFVHSLRLPVILALAATFIFASIRLLRRQSLRQVFAGLAGTLISVFWAWRSGQVENFFRFRFLDKRGLRSGISRHYSLSATSYWMASCGDKRKTEQLAQTQFP